MNSVFEQQVDALARLALTIRTGLTKADLAVPPINELLADLAEMGRLQFGIRGAPRHAGFLALRHVAGAAFSSVPMATLVIGCLPLPDSPRKSFMSHDHARPHRRQTNGRRRKRLKIA